LPQTPHKLPVNRWRLSGENHAQARDLLGVVLTEAGLGIDARSALDFAQVAPLKNI